MGEVVVLARIFDDIKETSSLAVKRSLRAVVGRGVRVPRAHPKPIPARANMW